MSLYGSLYSGVSGLSAQGSAISILADNISNINTVGYKAGSADFSTLVTQSSDTAYSSGGVNSENRQLIDRQGLIQSTGVATDIAISGDGFFVVNSKPDGQGDALYTRAGSFRKDSRGNFVNSAGYTLMAWPLDNEGRMPGAAGNLNTTSSELLDSLQPVNIKAASGAASATTKVELGLNLNAKQAVLEGAGDTIVPPSTSATNYNIASKDILVPNADLVVGNTITLTPSTPGSNYTFTYGGVLNSADITAGAGILGSTSVTGVFSGATAGDSFTITTPSVGTVTFTYTPTSPSTGSGQFNSLQSLSDAIGQVSGLTARIKNNQLYFGSQNATETVAIADIGGTFSTALGGNVSTGLTANNNRFNSMESLSKLINNSDGITGAIENPLDGSSVKLYATDPLGTLTMAGSTANILPELGLAAGVFGPAYDANGTSAPNMASGNITPQFSRNVRVFDSLGSGHDFQMSFVKIAPNTWGAEVYAINKKDISSSRTDGLVASGTLVFNGDGSLRSVSSSLTNAVSVNWPNKASPSKISFDFGTAGQIAGTPGATEVGKTDGLRQFDSDYDVAFVDQNGVSSGLLTSVAIDDDGYVIASYSNGETQNLYKLPIADFENPNGLVAKPGNTYAESQNSGNFNLKSSGGGGVGKVSPGSLEQANVELSDELTKMIVAQRGYEASSKVIKTANDLLDELNRIFG